MEEHGLPTNFGGESMAMSAEYSTEDGEEEEEFKVIPVHYWYQQCWGITCHFGADPQIRTSDKRIWIQIRIRLLTYLVPAGTLSSVSKIYFLQKFYFASIISVRSTPL
jgi:hypothetical protein